MGITRSCTYMPAVEKWNVSVSEDEIDDAWGRKTY